jgi:hypothetical protein
MADPFPEAVSKRQPVASNRLTCDSKGEAGLSLVSYPILFSSFFTLLAMELCNIISPPTATSFRQFARSGTRRLQPHQAVEPTVPELGMVILGARRVTSNPQGS